MSMTARERERATKRLPSSCIGAPTGRNAAISSGVGATRRKGGRGSAILFLPLHSEARTFLPIRHPGRRRTKRVEDGVVIEAALGMLELAIAPVQAWWISISLWSTRTAAFGGRALGEDKLAVLGVGFDVCRDARDQRGRGAGRKRRERRAYIPSWL